MAEKKVALVSGANRGIGLEIVRQLAEKEEFMVILACRDLSKGEKARESLGELKERVFVFELDVCDWKSIDRCVDTVLERFGRVDVLVNNAGVLQEYDTSAVSVSEEIIRRTVEVNTLGAIHLMQRVVPVMKEKGYGRIVNMSSGLGQLSEMGGGYMAYRVSKAALNAATRCFAAEAGSRILINSMCPGWVKTDMGGQSAPRSVEQGADTAVWLSCLEDGGPSGKFFRDRKEISW